MDPMIHMAQCSARHDDTSVFQPDAVIILYSKTSFNLAHEQICLLAREVFSFSPCKFHHVNSESAMAQA